MKLIEVIIVPKIIGFNEPNFEIMKPEVGPKTKKTKAKGNCMLPVLIASAPNPSGSGIPN
jgi:hypothetical protein